jgi:hypothetical protein
VWRCFDMVDPRLRLLWVDGTIHGDGTLEDSSGHSGSLRFLHIMATLGDVLWHGPGR